MADFLKEFEELLSELVLKPGHLVIPGDFNYHFDDPSIFDVRRFIDIFDSVDLVQHVAGATQKHGHTLDLVITRSAESILHDVRVKPALLSDHYPVACRLNLEIAKSTSSVHGYNKFRKVDSAVFDADIAHHLADGEWTTDNPLEVYNRVVREVADQHAPVMERKTQQHTNKPWFNKDIHSQQLLRRRLERRWLKSDLEVGRLQYLEQCEEVVRLIIQAKTAYYKSRLASPVVNHRSCLPPTPTR